MPASRISATLLALSLIATAAFAAGPLRSPWDTPPAAHGAGAYNCPALPPLPQNIDATSYYSDSQHSVIDQKKYDAYKQAAAPYNEFINAAIHAADNYRASGNPAAAACVLQLLDTQAAANAMTGAMSSNQAYYVQGWDLGALAVAWLKVRPANPGSEADRKLALAWLDRLAVDVHNYFGARNARGTSDGTNNHFYWAGFATMATAIAVNDRSLYTWSASTLDEAIHRIQPDGTLPLEMERGQRALHYHFFALAPIILLAEFEEANGDDPYAKNGRAIQRLVDRSLSGLADTTWFAEHAHAAQETPTHPNEAKSDDIAWLVPYLLRFPNPTYQRLLDNTTIRPFNYIGGYPPGYAH